MDVVHHQTQFSISISTNNSAAATPQNLAFSTSTDHGGLQNHQHSSSTSSSTSFDTLNDDHFYNASMFGPFHPHVSSTSENLFGGGGGIDPGSTPAIAEKSYMGYPLDANVPGVPMMPNSASYIPESAAIQVKEEPDSGYCQKENTQLMDTETMEPSTSSEALSTGYQSCFGCHDHILDKWLFVINNTNWHPYCLRCTSCNVSMNENVTCFWRENKIYCRHCYQTQFVDAKCAACQRSIGPKDWVRRAREFVYHLACFACSHCKRQLSTGEEFSINDNRLLCKQHYMELIHGHCKTKTKRVRTTFAEEQISVLQAHFQIDSNPDGADLEKIANITGLSKRVTQVWFQNSRARQKKYQGGKKSRHGSGSERCGSGANTTTSGRSSVNSSPAGSPTGSCEGMIFPTSVTTSAEEAVNGLDSKQLESLCYET